MNGFRKALVVSAAVVFVLLVFAIVGVPYLLKTTPLSGILIFAVPAGVVAIVLAVIWRGERKKDGS
ncbi:hypothetical protein [Thermococcus aciditolerans]|uniref:Uncharacterized protein n=1 Tax=Thermococcus aciditolerans TaxID=2598455 RepID=A0A5C0SN23_9EURY|nr:hypothetical protein [Thermococcus aciditolerans]QEK15382.1 hypothetical protein FPV09_10080 [Thermococcus aciditolerans]